MLLLLLLPLSATLLSGWLVFTQLVETSRPFVREASMVPVYGLLAFGGQLEVLHDQGLLLLDGWAKFKAPARVSGVVVGARLTHAGRVARGRRAFACLCVSKGWARGCYVKSCT